MRTFVDLVRCTVTSSGTGPFTLGNNVTGFFGREKLQDGASYSYSVQQGDNKEVGAGTYIASTNTLTRTVRSSSNGGAPVAFDVGAEVAFTFTAADIVDVIAAASSSSGTAKAAFNAYGLQWGVWFNGTPVANELLALYVAPVAFEFLGNFTGAAVQSPLTPPADTFTLAVDLQVDGSGTWTNVGSIVLGSDGSVSISTVGAAVVPVGVGDRLRVVAPALVDTSVAGFAMTFKGFIP